MSTVRRPARRADRSLRASRRVHQERDHRPRHRACRPPVGDRRAPPRRPERPRVRHRRLVYVVSARRLAASASRTSCTRRGAGWRSDNGRRPSRSWRRCRCGHWRLRSAVVAAWRWCGAGPAWRSVRVGDRGDVGAVDRDPEEAGPRPPGADLDAPASCCATSFRVGTRPWRWPRRSGSSSSCPTGTGAWRQSSAAPTPPAWRLRRSRRAGIAPATRSAPCSWSAASPSPAVRALVLWRGAGRPDDRPGRGRGSPALTAAVCAGRGRGRRSSHRPLDRPGGADRRGRA